MSRIVPLAFVLLLAAPRPASASPLTHMVWQDARSLVTVRNVGFGVLGLGLAGLAHHWDASAQRTLENNSALNVTAYATNVYGSDLYNLPVSVGLWIFARSEDHPELEAVSRDLTRALVYTAGAVGPIKLIAHRERPDHSNHLSFPSGHAANAFAIASVLTRHYGPAVGVPMYLFGALVAAGRIEGNHHYLSDVVGGAALGTIIGCGIVPTNPNARVSVQPVYTPAGGMLALQFRY